jgi:hypothetical protein
MFAFFEIHLWSLSTLNLIKILYQEYWNRNFDLNLWNTALYRTYNNPKNGLDLKKN